MQEAVTGGLVHLHRLEHICDDRLLSRAGLAVEVVQVYEPAKELIGALRRRWAVAGCTGA
jgi:hypothetical protein